VAGGPVRRTGDGRPILRGPAARLLGGLLSLCLTWSQTVAATEPLPSEPYGHLQPVLERILDELELDRAVQRGRLAVALIELEDRQPTSLGLVNGHQMMYAASLPKIAILYGAAVSLDRGRIEMDDDLHRDMIAMIRESCNLCATRVLGLIGRSWLLELLQSGPYRFYDPDTGGGLWVGKDYARANAFRRDPMKGLSHAATVWQAARWYYLLVNGELASPEQTDLMLEALSNPAISHKFVKGLSGRKTKAVYRKSGTWRDYHADSAYIELGRRSYILVAMAKDPRGGRWMESLVKRVHDHVTSAHTAGAQ
jgi:beta-lactamase class A